MKNRCKRHIQSLFCILLIVLCTGTAWAVNATDTGKTGTQWNPPSDWFIYLVILIVLVGSLLSILIIRTSLDSTDWSLSHALSESSELTQMDDQGNPVLDDAKKPVVVKKLTPSSSRMVALMGMIVILFMFLAFGSFSLFYFAKKGLMPSSINQVVKFLLAGLTLFAPYAVNKFSKLFEGLTPGK